MRFNTMAYKHALKLIRAGKIVEGREWSGPSPDLENEVIEKKGWDFYRLWFLGIDTDANEETKARYKYPFSDDFENINRRGVIAIKVRASQQNEEQIYKAASRLLELIDKVLYPEEKEEKETVSSTTVFSAVEKLPIRGVAYTDQVNNLNGIHIPVKLIVLDYYKQIGQPLLFNHDVNKVIGRIEEITKNAHQISITGWVGNWYSDVFLGVKEGLIKGISIGLVKQKEKYVLTEISLTPTPAVPTALITNTEDQEKIYLSGSLNFTEPDIKEEGSDTNNQTEESMEEIIQNEVKESVEGNLDNKIEAEESNMNVKMETPSQIKFATISINWGDVKQVVKDVTREPSLLNVLGVSKMSSVGEYVSFFNTFGNVYGEDNTSLNHIAKTDVTLIAKYFYAGEKIRPSEYVVMDTAKTSEKTKHLTKNLLFGIEDAIINGDTSATNQPRNYFDGLLKLGTPNTEDLGQASNFSFKKVKQLWKKLGQYSANPSDLVIIVDINGYDLLSDLPELLTVDKIGNNAFITTGTLANIMGMGVYLTPVSLTVTSGNSTHTRLIIVNKNLVRIGQYGDIEVKEVEQPDGSVAVIVLGFYAFGGLSAGIAIGRIQL